MRTALTCRLAVPLLLLSAAAAPIAQAADWPQLQGNAARTGRTTDSISPPYRFKWVWLGPTNTQTALPLNGGSSLTFASRVQPVIAGGRVFAGTLEGDAIAIYAANGQTAWTAKMAGPTIASAAVSGAVVVFGTVAGTLHAYDAATGAALWTHDSRYTFSNAPCVDSTRVYAANHRGDVVALDLATGALLWSRRLSAPVDGEIAADANAVYVPAEDMYVNALSASNGALLARHRVYGQSFRHTNPVVFNGKLWVTSVPGPGPGSEYMFEQVLSGITTLAQEETALAAFLNGDTANGGADASTDWRHYFALNLSDLSEPFVILAGPSEGTGHSPDSMVVDNSDRVLAYFKTKFPTLTAANGAVFGTAYSVDIAAVNQANGHRIQINNGRLANNWPWETDNLFHMTVGGNFLWLHQRFRGTEQINLATSTSRLVQANMTTEDGGNFGSAADFVYLNCADCARPASGQQGTDGWMGASISGSQVFISEPFGIVALGN